MSCAERSGDVASLPKVELHLHLEGAIRPETVEEFARRERPGWTWQPPVFQSFDDFIVPGTFQEQRWAVRNCFRTPDDFERSGFEVFSDLAHQNVVYAEVSFSLMTPRRQGLRTAEVIAALEHAISRVAREHDITVGLILGFGREYDPALIAEVVREAIDTESRALVGIDLHGEESAAPAHRFAEVYRLAKSAGLGLRAHAGEAAGPANIWDAIQQLGVTRIGHGVRAIEDPLLIDHLRDQPITLDICPTSNVALGVVPSYAAHPLRALFNSGVRVSLNSDDPLFFGASISDEFRIAHERLGFTVDELRRITEYAIDGAFLTDSEKRGLKRRVGGVDHAS